MTATTLKKLEQEGTLRTFYEAQNIIANDYGKQPYELKVKNKPKPIVEPRQVSMFVGFVFLDMTCIQVGKEYNKNHSTVLHVTRTVRNLYFSNQEFRCRIHNISDKLGLSQERIKDMMVERKWCKCTL